MESKYSMLNLRIGDTYRIKHAVYATEKNFMIVSKVIFSEQVHRYFAITTNKDKKSILNCGIYIYDKGSANIKRRTGYSDNYIVTCKKLTSSEDQVFRSSLNKRKC